jgi:hypothetical protein
MEKSLNMWQGILVKLLPMNIYNLCKWISGHKKICTVVRNMAC